MTRQAFYTQPLALDGTARRWSATAVVLTSLGICGGGANAFANNSETNLPTVEQSKPTPLYDSYYLRYEGWSHLGKGLGGDRQRYGVGGL